MEITLQVPEPLAKTLGYVAETLPRRALEALLVDECSRGRLSRGKVAEILGLSFHEAESLFQASRVPYPIKSSADDALAHEVVVAVLKRHESRRKDRDQAR